MEFYLEYIIILLFILGCGFLIIFIFKSKRSKIIKSDGNIETEINKILKSNNIPTYALTKENYYKLIYKNLIQQEMKNIKKILDDLR